MLKKGPEIKLSELKVPDFLQDLYYDLRERHLLPLVAILAVAIVVVPIALSQSSGSESSEEGGAAIAAPSAVTTPSGVLIAKSAPGLRAYGRRLDHLHPKDPFRQEADQSEAVSATGGSVESEAPSTESAGSSFETPSEAPAPSSIPPSETSGEPGPGNITYFSYAIDVRVVTGGAQDGSAGKSSSDTSTVRHNLPELTMLPGRETPAVIYMGSTKDGKKALMLISSDVGAIFGDGKCVLGSDTCELLAMEPGLPETFVYGGTGRTFKIELQKIHLVTTDKLNRAPLGKPKEQQDKQRGD